MPYLIDHEYNFVKITGKVHIKQYWEDLVTGKKVIFLKEEVLGDPKFVRALKGSAYKWGKENNAKIDIVTNKDGSIEFSRSNQRYER